MKNNKPNDTQPIHVKRFIHRKVAALAKFNGKNIGDYAGSILDKHCNASLGTFSGIEVNEGR